MTLFDAELVVVVESEDVDGARVFGADEGAVRAGPDVVDLDALLAAAAEQHQLRRQQVVLA